MAGVFAMACGLIVGAMFLFPNIKIFGFHYVSAKDTNTIAYMYTNGANISKFNIETENFDVKIEPSKQAGYFSVAIDNNYMGFAKGNSKDILVQAGGSNFVSVDDFKNENFVNFVSNNEFNIKLKELDGLISYGNSSVIIFVPENLINAEYNIKTTNGTVSFNKNETNKEVKALGCRPQGSIACRAGWRAEARASALRPPCSSRPR